uniref:Uncharacterized protein n=1 Tax=Anguilla anguilla TaxID=7936 RepID=A0A0E9RBF1_ANGAN
MRFTCPIFIMRLLRTHLLTRLRQLPLIVADMPSE